MSANADCTLSNDDNYKTCTGDITSGESFIHSDTVDVITYKFFIQELTSSAASTGGDYLFEFANSGAEGVEDNDYAGYGASSQEFYLNSDLAQSSYSVDARDGTAVYVYSIGGVGRQLDTNESGSDITGTEGGAGGAGAHAYAYVYSSVLRGYEVALEVGTEGGKGGGGQHVKGTFDGDAHGGAGGIGGGGRAVSVLLENVTVKSDTGSSDLYAAAQIYSHGGTGGEGGEADNSADKLTRGGAAGDGADAGDVTVTLSGDVVFDVVQTGGLSVSSKGGLGAEGGYGKNTDEGPAYGGDGGTGGDGAEVELTADSGTTITISGTEVGSGIVVESVAGTGGTGGDATQTGSADAYGGNGGQGGTGGTVKVDLSEATVDITTTESQSYGLWARSYGKKGGDGGSGTSDIGGKGDGGAAAGAGPAGDVTVSINGKITTSGSSSDAILVQSTGGFAGDGGKGVGASAYGGGSESAGDGGTVSVTWTGDSLTTSSSGAYGLNAQSVGGGGGKGGDTDGIKALGGSGSAGGDGGTVSVTSTGTTISVSGSNASGLFAQSAGGGGGNGGTSVGVESIGGTGSNGGAGGTVTVYNSSSIGTSADYSDGLIAQSVGGGGGTAHSTVGVYTVGSDGGTGGTAGVVTVTNIGDISTSGTNSDALFAQSQGGSGGKASTVISGGISYSQAVGGTGGTGGDAGSVTIANSSDSNLIKTTGDNSIGVYGLSSGGGGGHGGNAVSISASPAPSVAIALGGTGGAAGDGGDVTISFNGSIETKGSNSIALKGNSTGGGGGSSGTTVAFDESPSASVSIASGSDGGGGGTGGAVTVCFGQNSSLDFCAGDDTIDAGSITTYAGNSHGLYAGSHGGSGGHSGATFSTDGESFDSLEVAIGGNGGDGGAGGKVDVYANGDIKTYGSNASAVLAQSVGGGGGGAFMTGSLSGGSATNIGVAVGGSGGDAAGSGDVTVTVTSDLQTYGISADAISAISSGGNGGSGSTVIDGAGATGGSVNVGVGGSGGGVGDAGDVTVTWTGETVETALLESVGINAISQGGSGGKGGLSITGDGFSATGVDVSLGGAGGSGGSAGNVYVYTTSSGSTITTNGGGASAISALSMGGSGGRGGGSITGSLVSVGTVDVGIGADGGDGGTAGEATAINYAAIETNGQFSDGMVVISQGGSGGVGGYSIEGGISASVIPEVPAGNVTFVLGGTGGAGGVAETSTTFNSGAITTNDFMSYGILGQSLGGDGGRGGSVYSGTVNVTSDSTIDVEVDVGGEGGDGGASSSTFITNEAAITTVGAKSYGVLGQSIGGNGGTGGNSYNAILNIKSQSDNSANFDVEIGGDGGDGAISQNVDIENYGDITTSGESSAGIFAQSVGGNGGTGGNGGNIIVNSGSAASSSSPSVSMTASIQVGGWGGVGADADYATVYNYSGATISTGGTAAHGLWSQSVGGGGGDGGIASTYALTVTGTCSLTFVTTASYDCQQSSGSSTQTELSATVDIGGYGSAGGTGSEALVSNVSGTVTTTGDAAHAMFAQSVGGGGGTGGSGGTGITAFTTNSIADAIATIVKDATSDPYNVLTSYTSVSFALGGKGGAAGDGGTASAVNSGALSTSGTASHGMFAQSIGGGGGAGGSANAGFIYSLSIGGNGSAAGDGGTASVTNDSGASITTSGSGSFGILAQSVGGGGGQSGSKTYVFDDTHVNYIVGGAGGASGAGGAVTVTNNDTAITTQDRTSVGIFAQSIGGGGGLANDGVEGASSDDSTISVGGGDDSTGDGGAVTVTHSGDIYTAKSAKESDNTAAHGIVAQSVGGGGGYAGAVLMGSASNFGTSSDYGQSTEVSGTGGDVTVKISGGSITTNGGSAVGIFAQSVGGGGGVTGAADSSSSDSDDAALIGSGNGTGAGGVVKVTVEAAATGITTSGAGAHGIFAQSAGGLSTTTTTNTVDVNVYADISAPGAGSHGIFAQNSGYSDVTVTIGESAEVEGGTTATISGAETGAGVYVKGGYNTTNTIENSGTITNKDGTSGIAVNYSGLGSSSSLTVENSGTVIGKVENATETTTTGTLTLSSSTELIYFNNYGIVDAGSLLETAQFLNSGSLFIQDGSIGGTTIDGDLVQTSGGEIVFDYDPSTTTVVLRSDDLLVTGDATLAGQIRAVPITSFQFSEDRQYTTLLEVSGTLDASGLSLAPSVVGQYELLVDTQEVGMSYDIDFANETIRSALNWNQKSVSNHLDALYREGGLDDDIATGLIEIEGIEEFSHVMNTLGPELAIDNKIVSLNGSQKFADSLLSCAKQTGSDRFLETEECGWFGIGTAQMNYNQASDTTGFASNSWAIAGGAHRWATNEWLVGFSGAIEHTSTLVNDSFASSEGGQYRLGLSAKRIFGANEVSGAVSLSYGSFDLTRNPIASTSITGTQDVWSLGGVVRFARSIETGSWMIKPRIDIGFDTISMPSYVEQSTSGLAHTIAGTNETFFRVAPGLDIATEFTDVEGRLFRPHISLGLVQQLGDNSIKAAGRFTSASASLSGFTAQTDLPGTRFQAGIGLDVFATDQAVLRADFTGEFSNKYSDYSGGLKFEIKF